VRLVTPPQRLLFHKWAPKPYPLPNAFAQPDFIALSPLECLKCAKVPKMPKVNEIFLSFKIDLAKGEYLNFR
jgi:hypothetical protein